MAVEFGKIERAFSLSDELVLRGIATSDVAVTVNGVLRLFGIVAGNLRVEVGGQAYIDGTVGGTLTNAGGYVEIRGTVQRLVEQAGTTHVSPTASVAGRPYGLNPGTNQS